MRPHASYYTKQLKSLGDEVTVLRLRLQQLQEEHYTLQVQQHVLASVCDALHWIRGGHAQASVHRRWLAAGTTAAGTPSLPQQELELLEQLGALLPDAPLELQLQELRLQQSSSEGTADTADVTQPTQQTSSLPGLSAGPHAQSPPLQQSPQTSGQQMASSSHSPHAAAAATAGSSSPAKAWSAATPPEPGAGGAAAAAPCTMQPMYLTEPAGNYLGMLWQTLSRAPDPRARSMTLQQFAQYWAGLVKELSLCLALTEQQGPQYVQPQNGCAGMQHPLLALQLQLQQHLYLVSAVSLNNRADLVNRLRLVNLSTLELSDTPEQAWERIFWLMDRLQLREDQQLAIVAGCDVFKRLLDRVLADRQQLLQQQARQTDMRLPTGRCADLETEQQMARRLQVLARKEQFLVACAGLFMGCVLDVIQLAKAIVLPWPFVPHFAMLGPAVKKRKADAQQQAQLQQEQLRKGRGRGH